MKEKKLKVNRMKTEDLQKKFFELESGQDHVIQKDGQEVTIKGSSHERSKYMQHIKRELDKRKAAGV